jgi:hypothetical protein
VLFRGDPGWRAIGGLLIYPLHAFAALIVIVIVLASLLLAVAGAVGRGPHRRATRMRAVAIARSPRASASVIANGSCAAVRSSAARRAVDPLDVVR